MNDKAREAFEAWYVEDARSQGIEMRDGIAHLREGNHYGAQRIALCAKWEGFQAALQWAASQQAAEGWRPIETAPKDGRTILLGYFNSHGKWRTMRGQWISKEYIDEYWEDPEGVEAGWFETPVEAEDPPNCWPTDPTHWHQLPAPPPLAQGDSR